MIIKNYGTLISDPNKFQKLSLPEKKDHTFMFNEKKLVDYLLYTFHENITISSDIKFKLTPDGHVLHG